MSKAGTTRKPLNLNALRAQQADARGEKYLPFELTPEGAAEPEQFKILRRPWWSVETVANIDGKTDMAVLRELMGEADYARLVKAGFDLTDMKALYAEILDSEEDEPSLGESAGSSES